MPVTIVTDSSCDLPPEMVQQGGDIRIVPCSVSFGDQTYRDGIDINRELFYEMLTGGTVFPTTSQPAVSEFPGTVRRSLREEGREVVAVLLSGATERHCQLGYPSQERLGREWPHRHRGLGTDLHGAGIHGLGGRENGSGMGLPGRTLSRRVLDLRSRTHTYAMLDTAEYLRRGGRAGRAQSFLVSALQVKPIVGIVEWRGLSGRAPPHTTQGAGRSRFPDTRFGPLGTRCGDVYHRPG